MPPYIIINENDITCCLGVFLANSEIEGINRIANSPISKMPAYIIPIHPNIFFVLFFIILLFHMTSLANAQAELRGLTLSRRAAVSSSLLLGALQDINIK